MIIIINFLFNRRSRHRKHLSVLHHFLVEVKVRQPHQVLSSSHSILSKELLLEKGPVLSDKQFALGSEIEGIPNCYLWVSYEDVFVRFGFELFPAEAISIAAPNIKKTTTLVSCQTNVHMTSSQRT